MALDVTDLRSFYASSIGRTAYFLVCAHVTRRWNNLAGLSVLGLGYATPYLDHFRGEALRLLAMMPAEQGVVNWPSDGASASALIDDSMLPLARFLRGRVLLAHALETAEHPRELLAEIWRVLTPGGRLIVVAPNRSGLWARLDTTPFGHGRPYSRGQLLDLMRETLFSPIYWSEALYTPPLNGRCCCDWLRRSRACQQQIVASRRGRDCRRGHEAIYRLVGVRRVRRGLPELAPALRRPCRRVH